MADVPESPKPESLETELKFVCAPEDLDAVLAAAPAGDDQNRELISVYFDTPDLALEKAGASLRVRESGGRRVQTLKCGSGLRRQEHERPIEGLRPEGDLGPLQSLLPGGVEALKPAFNVRVTRRQRTFWFEGAQIELALDRGEVADGPRTSPICEVELELKSGPPAALFSLARALAQAAPLHLAFDTKADRGRALAAGRPLTKIPKDRPRLAPSATAADAFQAGARLALGRIAVSAACLREGQNTEAVHKLRVAVRRLRSALSTFKPLLRDDPAVDQIKVELRWLAKALDRARGLDVLAATLLDPELLPDPPGAVLERVLNAARREAHAEVAEVVGSVRYRLLMVDLLGWVETGAWLSAGPAAKPARAFARKALAKRRKAVLKRADALRGADEDRHALRIAAKKLRYAADGFTGLFPEKPARRFTDRLAVLQDGLGALNDAAVSGPLVQSLDLPPEAALEAGQRLGVAACGAPARFEAAAVAMKKLRRGKAYWA